jgi:hypothetical protein
VEVVLGWGEDAKLSVSLSAIATLGVGKTSLARSIADVLRRPFVRYGALINANHWLLPLLILLLLQLQGPGL